MRLEIKVFLLGAVIFCCLFLWVQQVNMFESIVRVSDSEKKEQTKKMVSLTRGEETFEIELETYLKGVVGSEMSPSYEMEALKAQAVAARTFVASRNYKVDDTTASQVYLDDEQLQAVWKGQYETSRQRVEEAVDATRGEIMTYEGKPITAFFFASSAGKTANSEEYYNSALAYLRSVDSPWDETTDEDYITTFQCTKEALGQALGKAAPVSFIQVSASYESGYVKTVQIDDQSYSGREIREALQLRSSCFTIEVQGEQVIFTIKGSGHGVGMSQEGAQGMALEGKSYTEILKHYYSGIQLDDVYNS